MRKKATFVLDDQVMTEAKKIVEHGESAFEFVRDRRA